MTYADYTYTKADPDVFTHHGKTAWNVLNAHGDHVGTVTRPYNTWLGFNNGHTHRPDVESYSRHSAALELDWMAKTA